MKRHGQVHPSLAFLGFILGIPIACVAVIRPFDEDTTLGIKLIVVGTCCLGLSLVFGKKLRGTAARGWPWFLLGVGLAEAALILFFGFAFVIGN